MRWSEQVWEKAGDIYQQIVQLPFNQKLMQGTLNQETFKCYIGQDALYLADFSRALAMIAARAPSTDQVLTFIRFAEGALAVEGALHADYFRSLGLPDSVVPSPTCQHYTLYLLHKAAMDNLEVAMAAVLPCFWIYQQVGDHIYQYQTWDNNPYQAWIDTYAGEAFKTVVTAAIACCDEVAHTAGAALRARMDEAFLTASRLEWMFWDSAYRQEKWPV